MISTIYNADIVYNEINLDYWIGLKYKDKLNEYYLKMVKVHEKNRGVSY